MSTFYEQLSKQTHLQAQITHNGPLGPRSWVGLIEDDVSIAGQASYEAPWEAVSDQASDLIRAGAALGSQFGLDFATDRKSVV